MKLIINLFIAVAAIFSAGCGKKKNVVVKKDATVHTDKKSKVASISTTIPVLNYGEELFDDQAAAVAFVDDLADQLDAGIEQARADMLASEDVEASPMKWDQPQAFRTIHFDFDKSEVRADQKELLAADIEAARIAIEQGKNVVVQGHCDQIGSPAYNLALSEKRAKTVKNELVAHGLPAHKIDVIGFGQEVPLVWSDAQTRTELIKELAVNRRAEFALS
jgi:outer membrane protein OmpA-like peptidoglycan-associated protein